ncbi:hypothetical protein GC087_21515 [Pantoea sp. JZ2]|uniref:HNH endonuclease n=1 Tax=Pantoea sp. JZ2 TaxID=2654189 RepID=UPI002B463D52|nr:HNH endonuclease [Pantoea sp. JZ2]WRH14989.1 hypothetical protein GC087_21515 [Pantoea sp. JZ2]
MSKLNELPRQEYLMDCFEYGRKNGALIWKERPLEHFINASQQKQFNTKFSKKIAGSIATVSVAENRKYRVVRLDGVLFYVHRIIYKLKTGDEPMIIDHISGNTLDNRIENLRTCSITENCRNARISETNTSGCTGISWSQRKHRWRAYITVNKKQIYLGVFREFKSAVNARKNAESRYGFHPNHGSQKR